VWLRAGSKAVDISRPLTVGEIQTMSASLRKVNITSEPRGAAIFIGRSAARQNDKHGSLRGTGKRRIRIEKRGLELAEDVCQVRPKAVLTFNASLTNQESRAHCK